jgi:hypothetical protein
MFLSAASYGIVRNVVVYDEWVGDNINIYSMSVK